MHLGLFPQQALPYFVLLFYWKAVSCDIFSGERDNCFGRDGTHLIHLLSFPAWLHFYMFCSSDGGLMSFVYFSTCCKTFFLSFLGYSSNLNINIHSILLSLSLALLSRSCPLLPNTDFLKAKFHCWPIIMLFNENASGNLSCSLLYYTTILLHLQSRQSHRLLCSCKQG